MRFWRPTRGDLTIEDIPEGLRFLIRVQFQPFVVFWNYVFPTYALYLLSGGLPAMPTMLRRGLVLLLGGLLGTWLSRSRTITVTFNPDGVRVRNAFAAGYPAPRWVPLGDISELFWLPESHSDPEGPFEPSGLYARRGLSNVCLLPYLEAGDTARALRAIEGKFSWVDRTAGSGSLLFADDLVRLDLRK